jgi:hypothetical protein
MSEVEDSQSWLGDFEDGFVIALSRLAGCPVKTDLERTDGKNITVSDAQRFLDYIENTPTEEIAKGITYVDSNVPGAIQHLKENVGELRKMLKLQLIVADLGPST